MSVPPQTTIVCSGVPEGWLFGIDTTFFDTTTSFRGIKLVPEGAHFVHWGADVSSVRAGHWVMAAEGQVVILKWDASEEVMLVGDQIGELDVSAIKSRLGDQYSYMVTYPESGGSGARDGGGDGGWQQMSRYISQATIDLVPLVISSTSTSAAENELLRKALYDSAAKRAGDTGTSVEEDRIIQSVVDQPDTLQFTPIDSKRSWREGAVGPERTVQSRDKSWYLNETVLPKFARRFDGLMGEFQLVYVLMQNLANYSAAQQWMEILNVVCYSDADSTLNRSRYDKFAQLVAIQLVSFPLEYIDSLLDQQRCERALANLVHNITNSDALKAAASSSGLILMDDDEDDLAPVVVT